MRNLSDLLRPSRNLLFVESVLLEIRFDARHVVVMAEELRREASIIHTGRHRCGNQPRPRKEERALPFPIPRLARRSGNAVVGGLDDGVDRGNVGCVAHTQAYHTGASRPTSLRRWTLSVGRWTFPPLEDSSHQRRWH